MKKLVAFSILLPVMFAAAAQQSRKYELATKDSLLQLLASSQPDTNRVMLYSELTIRNLRSSHDTAMKYAQKGLALARQLKFAKGEADCLRRSGLIYFQQGRYPEALDIYQQALHISEKADYKFGMSAGLGHIGNIYNMQGDYPQARLYYLRGLKISEKEANASEQATALANIGRSYLKQGFLDSASDYFNQVLKLTNETWDLRLSDVWTDMGTIQSKLGNEEAAKNFYRKSIAAAISINNFITLSDAYCAMAAVFSKSGNADSSIFYAKLGLTAAQQNYYAKGILTATELLSKSYESTNEHEALKYHKLAGALKDSLFNTEKTSQVQNLFFVEQQRREAAIAEAVKYKNQLKLYVLAGILIIILMVAVMLWRNNLLRKRSYSLLQLQKQETEQQKKKVEQALEDLKSAQSQLIHAEKMASLGQLTAGIAHEIQNPLNFVNNFSDVSNDLVDEMTQELDKGSIAEAKAIGNDIKQNLQKINFHGKRADAIVKGMLQHSQKSTTEKTATDINALADEYLRLAYHGMRAKDSTFNVTLKTDFDKSIDKVDIIPQNIGRVLLNIYNNAFYAVNEKAKGNNGWREPTVSVVTRKNGDTIKITIGDNGNGIHPSIVDKVFQPFFTTKPTGQGTGLGLSLAYDIIKSHGGNISVNSIAGESSEFIVILPG